MVARLLFHSNVTCILFSFFFLRCLIEWPRQWIDGMRELLSPFGYIYLPLCFTRSLVIKNKTKTGNEQVLFLLFCFCFFWRGNNVYNKTCSSDGWNLQGRILYLCAVVEPSVCLAIYLVSLFSRAQKHWPLTEEQQHAGRERMSPPGLILLS